MTTIPKKMREDMGLDPEYSRCALQGMLVNLIGTCDGRPTREHAAYYAGKKIQERWAIPPICSRHHGVDAYQDAAGAAKEIRLWVALNRATDEELAMFPRAFPSFPFQRERLNKKYGVYVAPPVPETKSIQYQAPVRTFRRVEVKPKLDEMEREIRSYARTNGCTLDEARKMITSLA